MTKRSQLQCGTAGYACSKRNGLEGYCLIGSSMLFFASSFRFLLTIHRLHSRHNLIFAYIRMVQAMLSGCVVATVTPSVFKSEDFYTSFTMIGTDSSYLSRV